MAWRRNGGSPRANLRRRGAPGILLGSNPGSYLGFCWNRVYADLLAQLVVIFKSHKPVLQREKCVVPSHPDVEPRMELGPQLPNDYISGANEFAAVLFYSPSLPGAVSAVSGASARFFMCHFYSSENGRLESLPHKPQAVP